MEDADNRIKKKEEINIADIPITGAQVYHQFGWESTFGSEATTIDKVFGLDTRITPNSRNNLIRIRGLNSRNVQKMIAGQYEGELTINFTFTNAYWLKAVLGSVSDGGSAPYTHTFSEADTIPSMTVEVGLDLGTTDCVRKFLGVKINRMTMTCSVNEPVKVNLECFYKKEAPFGTSLDGSPASVSEDPLSFHHAKLEYPNGTTIANVQSIEVNIENGLIRTYGLNSRSVNSLLEGPRSYSGRITHTFEDYTDFLEDVGTGHNDTVTEKATLELTISNGESGSDERSLVLLLGDIKLDTESLPINPNEQVNEDIDYVAEEVDNCVYSNNTSTTP